MAAVSLNAFTPKANITVTPRSYGLGAFLTIEGISTIILDPGEVEQLRAALSEYLAKTVERAV